MKYLFCFLFSATLLITNSNIYSQTIEQKNNLNNHIQIYFNRPVDTTVSSGVNAIYLNQLVDDTLIAYINRAKYSIDVAVYNYIQSGAMSNIYSAINNAYLRGVNIRWIYNGSSSNTGLSLLDTNIYKLESPTSSNYGIMHNKFAIIDANSSNPSDAFVWTGSTNWDEEQFNADVNNVVIIQDQILAQAYTMEFNQMWGSSGLTPNNSNSKFGPYKTNITPHTFTIDGKTIELYFSPSDSTNNHILSTIASANSQLFFGIYTFTDAPDANAIKAKIQSGIYCAGIMDQYSLTYTPYSTLNTLMGGNLKIYAQSNSIYHSKFVIIDPCDTASDPVVLTGSHNWTISADTKNDENTLIIHDATIANIYYQYFHQNFYDLGGTLQPCQTTNNIENLHFNQDVSIYPNPADDVLIIKNRGNNPTTISIFDIKGKTIMKHYIDANTQMNLDVHELSNGIYFVITTSNKKFSSQKLIIQHL